MLNGTPEQRPRWKRSIAEAESLIGERVGAAYAAEYFPPANKAAMEQLVVNLRKALALSIQENDWMGAATKKEAIAKLDAFDPKIGYRDNLETYDGLAIDAGTPLANRMAAAKWQRDDNLAKLGGPIDRTEWGMLPQTVNAYYNSTKNEIVFPAGILQQPFYGVTADPAVNYGGIGAVIGHEMGHGFDDQGSKSDGTGMLRNWWTDADRAAFDKRGDALVAQYGAFCPLEDGKACVNGRLTLGENIGDVGGLSLAYRAYKLSLNGKPDRGDRRAHRRSALLPRLGAGVAQPAARGCRSPAPPHRSAQPGGIPCERRRAPDGPVVQSVQRNPGRRALPASGGTRSHLVTRGMCGAP